MNAWQSFCKTSGLPEGFYKMKTYLFNLNRVLRLKHMKHIKGF